MERRISGTHNDGRKGGVAVETKYTCIVCPRSCDLIVFEQNGDWKVKGNSCPRGAEYGLNEHTHPKRMITTTVKMAHAKDNHRLLPVISSDFVPKDARIVTIEDSAELQITGIENLVSMETRNANAAGAGAITIRDLIKSSLRMRPERIVVGEVRGGEALDMLQAMNTGHDGSLSTGHANSTHDMLSRLETMVLQGADGLPLEAIRQQIASAVDIIVHLSRLRDHSRKTMEITEVLGYRDGEIQLNPLYVFEEDENSTLEKVSGSLVRTKNPLVNDYKLKLAGVKEVI